LYGHINDLQFMFRTDMLCEIGGSHRSAAEDCTILGCDAVSLGE